MHSTLTAQSVGNGVSANSIITILASTILLCALCACTSTDKNTPMPDNQGYWVKTTTKFGDLIVDEEERTVYNLDFNAPLNNKGNGDTSQGKQSQQSSSTSK